MKNILTRLLALTSAERKGVIMLVAILFVITGIQAFVAFHRHNPATFADSTFLRVSVFPPPAALANDSVIPADYNFVSELNDRPESFAFDPNKVSAGDLRRLGVSSRVARTWINYRLRGGRFRNITDISKIYGMTPELYQRLMPLVSIDSQSTGRTRHKSGETSPGFETTTTAIEISAKQDINICDSAVLVGVRGIGPVLSGRIIKYRRLLGGYYSMDQLTEVYGFPDSLVSVINRSFYADTSTLQTIDINQATEDLLRRHPYLGTYPAAGIIKYRSKVRKINKLEELKANGILSEEQYEKVKKYLDI